MPDHPSEQPLIPFDPLTGKSEATIPETPSVVKLRELLRQKSKLEFIRVASRSTDQRMLLQEVRQQCVELEKLAVLDGVEFQLSARQQQIQKLVAYRRHTAPKRGMRMAAATQKRRAEAGAMITKLQAEIIPFEAAKAELGGVAKSYELTMIDRCQFLKMVGMGMLALSIWNEAVAGSGHFLEPNFASSGYLSFDSYTSAGISSSIATTMDFSDADEPRLPVSAGRGGITVLNVANVHADINGAGWGILADPKGFSVTYTPPSTGECTGENIELFQIISDTGTLTSVSTPSVDVPQNYVYASQSCKLPPSRIARLDSPGGGTSGNTWHITVVVVCITGKGTPSCAATVLASTYFNFGNLTRMADYKIADPMEAARHYSAAKTLWLAQPGAKWPTD